MDAIFVLLAITLLSIKHFVVDFPLQSWPYQYMNKGTYGHAGGILHAALHVVGTFLAFMFLFWFSLDIVNGKTLYVSLYLAFIDGFIHYHIDWAKMNINRKMGWACNTHNEFWILLGVDQLLHMLTYILLIFFVIKDL